MPVVRVLVVAGPVGELPATVTAQVVASAWAGRTADAVVGRPLSAGGTEVLDVVRSARGGDVVASTVADPFGRPVPAAVLLAGSTAYVEASQAVGPHLVAGEGERAAWWGSSEGVGALLSAALASGAGRVVVALGPAAVRDGGAGLLGALGLAAPALRSGLAGLALLGSGDLDALAGLRARLGGVDLVAACVGDLPLLGPRGVLADVPGVPDVQGQGSIGRAQAAGARYVAELARVVRGVPGTRVALPVLGGAASPVPTGHTPRSGAGGGIAVAVEALGGRLLPGVEVMADAVGLAGEVVAAELVVVAVTALDGDELHDGVAGVVGRAAREAGVPVVVLAGRVEASRRELAAAGVAGAYAAVAEPGPFAPAGAPGAVDADLLARLAGRVAVTWSPQH